VGLAEQGTNARLPSLLSLVTTPDYGSAQPSFAKQKACVKALAFASIVCFYG